MKTRNHLFVFLLLLTSFFTESRPLTIGWELWYPYQYRDKNSELVGLDIDIMHAVLKEARMTAEFTELPWQRHLKYIQTGEFDIAMGTSFSSDRNEYAYFSIPYRQETVYLFVKQGNSQNIKLNQLADIATSNYIIGVEEGYYYGEVYNQLCSLPEFNEKIQVIFDIEENVQLLLNDKIDGFLADPFTVKSFEKKYKLDGKFERHSIEIYSDNIYLIASKKSVSPATFNHLNKSLATLKDNGTIDKIISKWQESIK